MFSFSIRDPNENTRDIVHKTIRIKMYNTSNEWHRKCHGVHFQFWLYCKAIDASITKSVILFWQIRRKRNTKQKKDKKNKNEHVTSYELKRALYKIRDTFLCVFNCMLQMLCVYATHFFLIVRCSMRWTIQMKASIAN